MGKRQLTLLIGVPGSGKSSLAQRLMEERPGCHLVSTDTIRAQLFGDESIQGAWEIVREHLQQQFRQVVKQATNGVIYDATNATQAHRQEAIALARAAGFSKITGIWLDTPLNTCLERNKERSRTVPETIIRQMHASLQTTPPSLQDGLDHLVHYTDNCRR
ncbi:MAG: AAA family ATPase [Kastovskya adunca ATA6-11-RM4]|jgi:predicted kinase|nr:AAA family ATPase [Kastovskya adunca ATA6-11-RM4]